LAAFIASRSKAQWEKTKPNSRCQRHASGEGEGQGQNYSSLHGNLLNDVWSFSGLAREGRPSGRLQSP
jgi:hypothetical protein